MRGMGRGMGRGGAGRDDQGSVLPLTIGFAALALAAVLVCADATSLYLAQKRLDATADAAALAGADGFVVAAGGDGVSARLTDAGVRAQVQDLVAAVGADVAVVAAGTVDGTSARVTVATRWHPPIVSVFVPEGVLLQSTATTRTALG